MIDPALGNFFSLVKIGDYITIADDPTVLVVTKFEGEYPIVSRLEDIKKELNKKTKNSIKPRPYYRKNERW